MRNAKQKSSAWRPWGKRHSWDESMERHNTSHWAETQAYCERLGLWRSCPAARCQRMHGCAGDPRRCSEHHRLNEQRAQLAVRASADVTGIAKSEVPRFAMSTAEAAAAIAASIANLKDPLADDFPVKGKL